MPRRYRPATQGLVNLWGSVGSIVSPLWVQAGLWGAAAVGLLLGYNPPKRHSRYDHLSFWQKVGLIDWIGAFLLAAGATLFIVGSNLGGGQFPWSDGHVLGTLISGFAGLIAFGVYEIWDTQTGMLHHELFRGVNRRHRASFGIFCILFFFEGAIFFSTAVWYPTAIAILFETDPLLQAVNLLPVYLVAAVGSVIYDYSSSKMKSVRWPLCVGFFIWTCGLIGQATVQPGQHATQLGTGALVGLGLSGPLTLILAGIHLSVPYHLIGTASATVVSSRALGASIFTAVYSAAVRGRLSTDIPSYVSQAALRAGLPPASIRPFIGALTSQDTAALPHIPGVTPQVIASGVAALQQAYADGIRVVYEIAAPVAFAAVLLTPFLLSLKDHMDYKVDAPVEKLHNKQPTDSSPREA